MQLNALQPSAKSETGSFGNGRSYGPLEIQVSEKDEVYQQILARKKEFVTWVPQVNVLQGLEYLKIELIIPGISKEDCKIGNAGVLLWIKVDKVTMPAKTSETFHWSFILPEHLVCNQIQASYNADGKLVILVPKDKEFRSQW